MIENIAANAVCIVVQEDLEISVDCTRVTDAAGHETGVDVQVKIVAFDQITGRASQYAGTYGLDCDERKEVVGLATSLGPHAAFVITPGPYRFSKPHLQQKPLGSPHRE
jgi:hypothetical protein